MDVLALHLFNDAAWPNFCAGIVYDSSDVSPIRSVIESELLALQSRHKRQKAEATYRENSAEVKKIYERMRCGTLGSARGSSDPLVLPPLSVFCALPSIRALKGSPDPNRLLPDSTSVASDINSPLAISLIASDLRAWLIPIEKHLMTLLGYPSGWQSASARTLPPLKRVTARFFCRECGQGKVGRRYERERCLDFKGVCSHVCVAARGKKGGVKTLDWKVDTFEKDDKVSPFLLFRPAMDAHAHRPFLWLKPYWISWAFLKKVLVRALP